VFATKHPASRAVRSRPPGLFRENLATWVSAGVYQKRKSIAVEATGTMWGEGVGYPPSPRVEALGNRLPYCCPLRRRLPSLWSSAIYVIRWWTERATNSIYRPAKAKP
jgi:hypothetical protein